MSGSASVTYLEAIRLAQQKALSEDPRVFIYGQDIGVFGGAFTLEQAVRKLTRDNAEAWELHDRGVLREGQKVSFELVADRKSGKMSAENLKVLG